MTEHRVVPDEWTDVIEGRAYMDGRGKVADHFGDEVPPADSKAFYLVGTSKYPWIRNDKGGKTFARAVTKGSALVWDGLD